MVIPRKYKDVKLQTNEELIREKNELVKSISKEEKKQMRLLDEKVARERAGSFKELWIIEDEGILYRWNLERLIVVLREIRRRVNTNKWLYFGR
ncbi:MAG: hypothetical protein BWY30_00551 [Tenericutes bacterium ADurb.Bin239]|nr:MAG: hypothetical protein BWY30_00551 [Tenericutes bacterium ADurb.Bin239]